MKPTKEDIQSLIQLALTEDAPKGDATTEAVVPLDAFSGFKIIAKEEAVVCGSDIAVEFFSHLSQGFEFEKVAQDGELLQVGGILLSGRGPSRTILTAERSILNILQRLCGIATLTRSFVDKAEGSGITILDTRKTAPGLRLFEKYAVSTGGGTNHRFGLSDMIMLKENHLMIEGKHGEGYIRRAVQKCRDIHPSLRVEVEIRSPLEAEEAASSGADVILLDNMSPSEIKKSVKIIQGRTKIEVSGNVDLKNIHKYLIRGVDYISIGALTHSYKSSDLSLLIDNA